MDLLHTVFTIIQNITPPHTVRSTLSALYPLKKSVKTKRQQGTLLSCQLMINGSASHLHHHCHNFPGLTTHTVFHCSERWPLLGHRALSTLCGRFPTFTLPVIWNYWQMQFNISSLSFCISLMTPSALISLVCSKHPLHLQRVGVLTF